MAKFDEFKTLIEKAGRETAHLSGGHRNNTNIRQIIENADDDTIAFTCLMLEDHVHLALAILCELVPLEKHPPIPPEYYAGRIPVIKACWQYWAIKNKYVSVKHDPSAYWVEDKYGNRADWH